MINISRLLSSQADENILIQLNNLVTQLVASHQNLSLSQLQGICDQSIVLVARDDNKSIVGTLTIVPIFSIEGIYARLEDVIVDKNSQGKGTGSQLLEKAITIARESGYSNLSLTTASKRVVAQNMYQKHGFVKTGSTDKFKLYL